MPIDPTVVAIIGTLFGGVGLNVVGHWLGRNRVKIDDAAALRNELRLDMQARREEIRQLETEVSKLETEVDKWKREYYDLLIRYSSLETDLKLALYNIRAEVAHAEATAKEMSIGPTDNN